MEKAVWSVEVQFCTLEISCHSSTITRALEFTPLRDLDVLRGDLGRS